MKEMYRGYTILYHPSDDWLGFIYPPGETEARGEPVRTTRAKGAVALLQKARARIDRNRSHEYQGLRALGYLSVGWNYAPKPQARNL